MEPCLCQIDVVLRSECVRGHGQLRGGSWALDKQSKLAELFQTHTADWPDFRAAIRDQVGLDGDGRWCSGGEPDYLQCWQFFKELPSFTQSGTVLKFSRWRSAQVSWRWYRGGPFLLRLVHWGFAGMAEDCAGAGVGRMDQRAQDAEGTFGGAQRRVKQKLPTNMT